MRIDQIVSMCLPRRGLLIASCILPALATPALAATVVQTNLVTDDQAALASLGFSPAATVDPNLINPWGVSHSATSPFWISNQGTATSTLHDGTGAQIPLIVTIPGNATGPSGPTGQVFNGGTAFNLANGAPGRFFFSNLDGSISGWNGASGTTATQVVGPSSAGRPAIYTGLTIGTVGALSYLYAANDLTGHVDVFDSNFAPASLAGTFTDPGPNPDGLVPFDVKTINGHVFVTYTVPGPDADEAALGTGFVSEFNTDGTFVRRLVSGGPLASPWGLAIAPATFGNLAGSLLVGNFNEEFGTINGFSLTDGSFLGSLLGTNGKPINIPFLWEILTGNGGAAGDPGSLFFSAGIGDEEHGLFGRFDAAAVPEPGTWALMTLGLGLIGGMMRARQRRTTVATFAV